MIDINSFNKFGATLRSKMTMMTTTSSLPTTKNNNASPSSTSNNSSRKRRSFSSPRYNGNSSKLYDTIHQVKQNDPKMKEIDLNCSSIIVKKERDEADCTPSFNIYNSSSSSSSSHCHCQYSFEIGLLSVALQNNTEIETVRIDIDLLLHNDDDDNDKHKKKNLLLCSRFLRAISSMPNLKHLDIRSGCKSVRMKREFPISLLTQILRCPTIRLQSLGLYSMTLSGTEQEFQDFNDALLVLSCTTLSKFKSFQLHFTDNDLEQLVTQSLARLPSQSSLQSIHIVDIGGGTKALLSAQAIHAICEIKGLECLALNGLCLGPTELSGICQALEKGGDDSTSLSSLQSLNLSWNNLSDRGCQMIADSLFRNRHGSKLQELYIASNELGPDSGLTIAHMIQPSTYLSHSSGLQCLDISNNHIEDPGIVLIATSLVLNDNLHKLHMNFCSTRDDGIKAVAVALRMNQTLRELQIRCIQSDVSDAAYQTLIPAMEHNSVMQKLVMDLYTIPRNVSSTIIKHCAINRSPSSSLSSPSASNAATNNTMVMKAQTSPRRVKLLLEDECIQKPFTSLQKSCDSHNKSIPMRNIFAARSG